MIFLLFLIIPYIITGLFAERRRYAVAAHEYSQLEINKDTWQEEYDKAKFARDAIEHRSHCYLNYEVLKKKGCTNCTTENTNKYNLYTSQMKKAKNLMGALSEPHTNPLVIVGWPVYGTGVWLKSGTVPPSKMEISNETRIAQLEKELEIG